MNIPADIMRKAVKESPILRDYILANLPNSKISSSNNDAYAVVVKTVKDHWPSKIAAIKEIRNITCPPHNLITTEELQEVFPTKIFTVTRNCVGLADAKWIVEEIQRKYSLR